ncbi:MAG: hypothetical protein KC729_04905, partial [Candidatus Eisenbacteria bacterium]|nr:hypothetical protein [Candidatus Eisenbacteria bacterium]
HRMRLGPQDGFVYVTSLTVVQRLSLETGRLVDNFIDGVLEGAQTFVDFLFEPSGDLLVLDNVTANIRRYRGSDGTYQGQFANVGATGMTSPKAMEYGPDGRIYVVGSGALGNTIQVFRATDGAPEGSFIQPGSGGLTRGQGMLFHADGSLYVSNGGDNSVLRYSATTGSFLGAFVDPGSGGLQNPHGLAFGPDGHLYVASRSTHSVKRYDGSSGAYLGDAISPGAGGSPGSGGLIAPAGLLFVPAAPAEVADDGPDAAPLRVSTSPNPFPAGVVFTMDLGRAETVTIDIIDVRGRRVRRIASRLLGPGRQSLHWDGARDDGKVAGAGVYYYRAHAGQSEASGTIVRSR